MKATHKSVLILLAALVLAAAPLFANGKQESGTGSTAGTSTKAAAQTGGPEGYPPYTGAPTTITMWAWTSNENFAIDTFEKAYPNIKVKWSNVGVDYSKVMTATSAGKGLPDVIMSEYLMAPQLIEYGSFQPMNKWVTKQTYLKYFPAVSLKWTSMDGNIYGTPQDSGAMIMVYRKDIYDKYGLSVPKTWAQFRENALKLRSENPNIKYANFPYAGTDMTATVWQAGGRLFDYANGKWYLDFTNPTAMKVFKFWNELTQKHAIDTTPPFTADWFKEIDTGKIASIILGAWFPEWLQLNSTSTAGKWRVAGPPQWDPANPHNGVMGGSGFYVSKQSKNPQAASLFVLWLNSQANSLKALHDHSQLPILVSTNFTNNVAKSYEQTKYAYFGNQEITPVALNANNDVNTSFVWLPVISYLQSTYEEGEQQVFTGKQNLMDLASTLQTKIAAFMKKQGFKNLVVGELPQATN